MPPETAPVQPQSAVNHASFKLRVGSRLTAAAFFVWACFSLLLTWQSSREHAAHFRPQMVILLFLTIVAACIVMRVILRWARVRRMMLPLVAGFSLAIPFLLEPWALAVTAGVFLVCYGLGRFVRECMGLAVAPGSAEIALSAGLGLALSSWVLFWLGLAHLYRTSVLLGLVLLLCLVFRKQIAGLRSSCRQLHETSISILSKQDAAVSIGLVFGLAHLLMGLIVVLTPALGADFVAFHLPLIRFYAAQHALLPIPALDYSFYPQGLEVLMTFGQVLAGQAASQLIAPIFFVLLLLLLPALAHELKLSAVAAALGIVFVSALPFLHRTAVFAKNDPAMALFQLGALLCYFRARRDPDGAWLRLGVIFLAASFAVKHVALFGAIPIFVLYLRVLRRHCRPVREAAILVALFTVIVVPWHARTFLYTGNPLYPSRFDQATAVMGRGENAPAGRSKIGYLLIPLAVLFRGEYFFESPSSNPLGILFILLFGAWLAVRRRSGSRVERACLLFILAYYLYWGAIWPVVRYAIIPVVLLAVMTAGRLTALRDHLGRFTRRLALSMWAYGLFFALLVMLILEVKPGQIAYLISHTDKSQYLKLNDRRYASLEFLTRTTGAADLIYSVRNCAAGFAPDPAQFYCYPIFAQGTEKDSLFAALRERPYRYLIFPQEDLTEEWIDDLTPLHNLALVYRDDAYGVYRMGPP